MLTLEHLETLRVITRARTFSEAAEELFLTQPAISQRVKQMESAFGVRVFHRDRHRREVVLTPAGERILAYANSVLDGLSNLQQELSALESLERNTITIATGGPFIAKHVLPHLLADCRERLPGLRVSVTQAAVSHLNDAVRSGEADFAVQSASQVGSDLAFVPFYADRLILVAAPSHPVVSLGIGALAGRAISFVLPPAGTEARRIAERWASSAGLQLDVVMESISFDTLIEAVQLGFGLSIVSEIVARAELNRGRLATAQVPGLPVERQLCFAWNPDRPMSSTARDVLEAASSGSWRRAFPQSRLAS